MALVQPGAAPAVNVEAAVAAGAAIQQAVQAAIPAATPAVAATITNDPVVLPATGAAPEVVAEPANVVAPLVQGAGGAAAPATDAPPTTTTEPQTKAQQLAAKIDVLTKRIEADSKKREQLEALLRSVDLLDGIKAGSIIVAKVGRAETAKEVVATVVGVQTLESGDKRFKIYHGEGFDADTVVIQESQIVDVKQV